MTSPPAQKARSPAPRTTTALIAASFSQLGMTFSNSRIMPCVNAFSALGRLSVMRPRPSLTSNRISGSDIRTPSPSALRALPPYDGGGKESIMPPPLYGGGGAKRPRGSSHQKPARNDHAHDLVGAFEDLMHPEVAQITLDGKVLQVAVAAMQLQRIVDDPEADVGGEALAHGGGLRRLGRLDVEQRGGAPDQQPRGVEVGRHVGQLELRRLEVGQRLAELLALDHVARRRLQAGARAAQRAGADIDASAVEPGHGDLEAVALRPQAVGDRHLAVLEHHRASRLAVPAELLLLLAERQTRRSSLDNKCGDAARPLPAGAQHDDIDVAAPAAGDERLGAVHDIMIA